MPHGQSFLIYTANTLRSVTHMQELNSYLLNEWSIFKIVYESHQKY